MGYDKLKVIVSDKINLQLFILIACVFICYFNTLYNGFVYDDDWQIVDNSWITSIKYIPAIFTHDATHAEYLDKSNYYRPLMNIIYMFNYYLFSGLKPWGFHLVNVLFHSCVTVFVFLIARVVSQDSMYTSNELTFPTYLSIPFITALLFAIHPIHTEVVAWVAGIPELTFTLFCLISMYLHIKSRGNFDRWHCWSLISFIFAIFSKETSVMLLPILALYDMLYRSVKFDIRYYVMRYSPYVMLILLYLGLRLYALGGMAPLNRHPELNAYELTINILPLFAKYIGKLILPINMNAFYILHPVHSIFNPVFLMSLAAIIGFIAIGYVLYCRNKAAFLGFIIIIAPLLPVLYIKGLGENTFADRYLYFPSFGYALILATFIHDTCSKIDLIGKISGIFFIVMVIAFSVITIDRNTVWHDNFHLYTDTLAKSPDAFMMHTNLGLILAKNKDLNAATKQFDESLRINHNDIIALVSKGVIFANSGNFDAAIHEYKEAISINPDYYEAHMNLGVAFSKIGDVRSAIQELTEATRINPDNADAHIQLGIIQSKNNNTNAAVLEFKTAIQVNPNSARAHFHLGGVFDRIGDLNAAIYEYKEALRIDHANEEAHVNLGVAFAKQGDLKSAGYEFNEALKINPSNNKAQLNLRSCMDLIKSQDAVTQ